MIPQLDWKLGRTAVISALRLEGQPTSSYGEKIVDLTRLSPTIYPILFAALASRFFKNLARWRLENREGIELATLEQIFGSQNIAGAVERLLFVRTQVLVGILIVLIWSLSPLGGQSAARLLRIETAKTTKAGTVYFSHSGLQASWYVGANSIYGARPAVNSLYTSSLLSSPAQKRSPIDLWDLPKIPQWPRGLVDSIERQVDQDALVNGNRHYSSLLGVKLMGLDIFSERALYEFTVETSYYDFECSGVSVDDSSAYVFDPGFKLPTYFNTSNDNFSTFAAWVTLTNMTEKFPNRNLTKDPVSVDEFPPAPMQFAALDRFASLRTLTSYIALFNCDILPVIVKTKILCNSSTASTGCRATHQQRVRGRRYTAEKFNYVLHDSTSSTEHFLAGELYPFSKREREFQDWSNVSTEAFSRRLTTAFNTYWQATLEPFDHSTVSFRSQPPEEKLNGTGVFLGQYLNSTEASATVQYDVYRGNRQWVAILVMTTICLQVLAVAGVVLQSFIRGPDILGFASSLTRENPHVGLPPGGSGLDGPARARALGRFKVQLADIYPKEELGYIAFKSVKSLAQPGHDDDGGWRPLEPKRPYL
ncbi:hypothetical protein FZEAL_5596 [Fusarium zealandicum]|uniref:Uncharacterized protein n=1 Tax=Fusarium zealandicum TaxID=1053134 RepID=A0A8H4UJV6_9HYPO|nr:hypothetical protein FZEAL_5596 [Fusarium zealandicum]